MLYKTFHRKETIKAVLYFFNSENKDFKKSTINFTSHLYYNSENLNQLNNETLFGWYYYQFNDYWQFSIKDYERYNLNDNEVLFNSTNLVNENETDGVFDNSFHTDQPNPINENTAYLSEFPINVEILLLSLEHFN